LGFWWLLMLFGEFFFVFLDDDFVGLWWFSLLF